MRTISTLDRTVDDMLKSFEKPKYPVDGWEFFQEGEIDHKDVLPIVEGMPSVSGFLYRDDKTGLLYGEQT